MLFDVVGPRDLEGRRKREVATKKMRGEEFSYFNVIACTSCQDCPAEIFALFWERKLRKCVVANNFIASCIAVVLGYVWNFL